MERTEPIAMLSAKARGGHDADDGDPSSLVRWLRESALPLWADIGVDRASGGFFEKLDAQLQPVAEPRRTRVVARQIYVFATAAARGWLVDARPLVDHGLSFLFERLKQPDGTFASAVLTDGTVVDDRFDLYEQAFALFALAAAADVMPEREAALRSEAEALLSVLRDHRAHPDGGFREIAGAGLRSNPHMHLLEAALAWSERSNGPSAAAWDDLVTELVDLCLARMCWPASGALTEFFDDAWRPVAGARGEVVEPGHQFEWSWLLARVGRRHARRDAAEAAARLLDIGERHGVDPRRNVACDALDTRFAVTDPAAKLWPQTERIKAWHSARETAVDADARSRADRGLERAIRGIQPFLQTTPAGIWHEQMRADGTFVAQSTRASSFYHVVCAIETAAPADARAAA